MGKYLLRLTACILLGIGLYLVVNMGVTFFNYAIPTTKEGNGIVVKKYIVPQHYQNGYIMVGKSMSPTKYFRPTTYNIVIAIDSLKSNIKVDSIVYNSIEIDDSFECTYSSGGVFNEFEIKEFKGK